MLLSGCITADRPELDIDIPPAYRAAPGARDDARPALDWWRGFRSGELTSLIEEAQTANFDVAAAVARILEADAQSKIAGAPLIPTIDLRANAVRSRASQANGSTGRSERVNYTVALDASYEIDFWGKNRAISRAAQESAIFSRFDRDTVKLGAVVSVATAYFLVLSSQDRLRIARSNLAAASRVLTLIRQRQEAGTASQLEVAQQETLVATQRAAIPTLDQAMRQNMATLAVLIGRAPVNLKVRGGSLYRLGIPRVTAGLPSELMLQRPDIRAAEAQLASADASVEAARAAFYPSITLTGQYGVTSMALKNLFTPQAIFYNIAANLAQPIVDGFRLEGQLELAKGRQIEFLNVYRKAIVSAFGDVEIALIAVADATERERLQQQVVTSSQRAFDIAETRLREGTVDLVTVLITQQALFTAQDNRVEVRLARLQAVLSLFQALGGSWFPPPAEGISSTVQ
ncbi:MAG: outer membrane protein multidrug efflux system [Alphaproteobacteria bacterium]|jgi:NodT family efflux transporter outer membrane factor (OMF) lipoprotein|nr:outer membrane protein multidrug efflux system [Alphaproteobacteria bacterium]